MKEIDRFQHMPKGFDMTQAVAEADRCLLCHDAPCSRGCPADTDPAAFIRKLRFRNLTGAVRTIKTNNILGGACGVLCPTARLCEKACSASGIDRPIQIGRIQRFLVEHGWERGFQVFEKSSPRPEKVAVVGSGPAGLSCAAELARNGFAVTVFEKRPEPGGVLRYGVVSSRFDASFLEKELEDIRRLGVQFQCRSPVEGPAAAERLLQEGYEAVFLGPGLWDAHRLREDRPDIKGVYASVDYLEALSGDRLEAMAAQICGRVVAVVGGGSVAMDCVTSAAQLGAADVYLVYRRSFGQMPAEEDERIEALRAGVHFLLLQQPIDFAVDDAGRLKGLRLVRTRLGAPDNSGRRTPETVHGSEWLLAADMVVEAIGNRAEKGSSTWYPHVSVDRKQQVKVDPATGRTSVDGIFAGGDIVRGPSLVVNAVRDGKTAAAAIKEYLNQRPATKEEIS